VRLHDVSDRADHHADDVRTAVMVFAVRKMCG